MKKEIKQKNNQENLPSNAKSLIFITSMILGIFAVDQYINPKKEINRNYSLMQTIDDLNQDSIPELIIPNSQNSIDTLYSQNKGPNILYKSLNK